MQMPGLKRPGKAGRFIVMMILFFHDELFCSFSGIPAREEDQDRFCSAIVQIPKNAMDF